MGKIIKINITLSEEDLKKIDEFVKRESFTRSGFIREAVKSYIAKVEAEEEERKRRERMKRAVAGIRQLRKKAGNWNGVSEIRKWRDTLEK